MRNKTFRIVKLRLTPKIPATKDLAPAPGQGDEPGHAPGTGARLASQTRTEQAEAMSNRAIWDFDCAHAQARIVQMWWYQEPMAQGLSLEVTYRTDTQWHPVAPGSQTQTVMAVVCRH